MERIGCGNCGGQHDSVNDIRLCYAGKLDNGNVKTMPPATEKQLNLAHMLARTKVRLEEHEEMEQRTYEDMIQGMSRKECSKFIDRMLKQAKATKGSWDLPHPEVPAGRYALERDDTTYFYMVADAEGDRPRRLLAMHGAPGDWSYTIVRNSRSAEATMKAIAEDVIAALKMFADRTLTCGLCGSPLTDEISRARGYGPVCANKL